MRKESVGTHGCTSFSLPSHEAATFTLLPVPLSSRAGVAVCRCLYSVDGVDKFGAFRGCWLGRRLRRGMREPSWPLASALDLRYKRIHSDRLKTALLDIPTGAAQPMPYHYQQTPRT